MWRFRQTPGIYSDRKNSERQGSGCGGGRFCRTGFALEWRGRGLSGGSRILRQQKGQEPNQEGRRALSSPSRREDVQMALRLRLGGRPGSSLLMFLLSV